MFRNLIFLLSLPTLGVSSSGYPPPAANCLTQDDAAYLVNNYANNVATSGRFNATIADRIIAEGINVTSQSVNALMGKTGNALQGVTFAGKQAVIDSEKNKANNLTIEVIKIDAVDCETIGWRWLGISPSGDPFKAISIFYTVKTKGVGWQIKAIYGEFNSLTYAQNLGANVTFPPR